MFSISLGIVVLSTFVSFSQSLGFEYLIPNANCTVIFVGFKQEGKYEVHENKLKPEDSGVSFNPRVILELVDSLTNDSLEEIRNATTRFSSWRRPTSVHSITNCHYVILPIPNILAGETEAALHSLVNVPKLSSGTHKNADKFLIFADAANLQTISESKTIQSIKQKLICTGNDLSSKCYNHCPHCPQTLMEIPVNILETYYTASDLFPDFQKNFWKSVLKLSTTDKVPQLLEMRKDPVTNHMIPLRGLYASVLEHMEIGLNFTAELLISTGGGSTGHQLPNGTWAGIIGDLDTGRADIGFMAAVTYSRYQVADICAPINYAYIGFVTGPPQRIYTWEAIFWPFDKYLWIGTAISIAVAVLGTKLMMHEAIQDLNKHQRVWNISTAFEMYCKSFLDQGDDKVSTDSTNFSMRLFIFFWLMSIVVLSTAYRSKMVSFMTFPVLTNIPEDFEQLADDSKFSVDFHYFGNVGYVLFKTSKTSSFVSIFNKMNREPDPLKCLERTVKVKSACIIFVITFEELKHRNFSDQRGHSPLKFQPYTGVMFPAGMVNDHKSKLQDSFYGVLSGAMEMGLMEYWEKEDLQKTLRNKNAYENEVNRKWIDEVPDWNDDAQDVLELKNLKGALAVFVTGISLSFIAGCKEFLSSCKICTRTPIRLQRRRSVSDQRQLPAYKNTLEKSLALTKGS